MRQESAGGFHSRFSYRPNNRNRGSTLLKRMTDGGSFGQFAISIRVIVTISAARRGTNINGLGEGSAFEVYPVRCRSHLALMDRAERFVSFFQEGA